MKPWASVLALLLGLLIAVNVGMAATSTVVLTVDGMTWGAWPVAVKKALEGLKGVNRADVSLKTKEAVVAFDTAQVTVEQMIAAVERLGFRATLKQR
jgi:periplasmic mercuric ion binding protein